MKLVTDKLLFFMVGRNVIYNVNWEDPRVEREVLNLNESDNVITIASAGCNSLDYIIDGAKVTACDLNDCQIALCEIKVAAAKILTYEEFFSIFASNDCDFVREIYPKRLRHMLTAPSASFWDEKIKGIDSFMYFGASGGLAYVAFRIFFPMIGLGWIRNACAERMPPNEFQGIIDVNKIYIKTAAWLIKKGEKLRGAKRRAGNALIPRVTARSGATSYSEHIIQARSGVARLRSVTNTTRSESE